MINEKKVKMYCCEDFSLIENYEEAVKSNEMYDAHHKLGLWFNRQWLIDNGFYYDQRAEMLMFIRHKEHISLHQTGQKYHLGRKLTDEHKQKIGDSHRGSKHYNFGKHRSEETKRKISKKLKGVYNLSLSKKVRQYTKDGVFIAEYPSLAYVERLYGFNHSDLSCCCHGKTKTSHGFVWRFAE